MSNNYTARYWLPDSGQTEADAYKIESPYFIDPEDIGEDFHSNHDGWECDWPIRFMIDLGYGPKLYAIDRESVPHFYACQVTQ